MHTNAYCSEYVLLNVPCMLYTYEYLVQPTLAINFTLRVLYIVMLIQFELG